MTTLRKRMLEELQRRNYSSETIRAYLFAVKDFATYFGKRPDQLRQEHLRQYQLHLLNERKLTVDTIVGRIAALRFFFGKVLRRPYRDIDLVYPKRPERLPVILSEEEVGAVDRIGSYLLPSRDSDDLVRGGIAPRGTLPIEGDRCR
jgi:integrase/recombinase XerD